MLLASLCGACGSDTGCYGIAGEDALQLALSIQAQSRENPIYAHGGVPIEKLRPALILPDKIYRKGDGLSATKILFVDPKSGRRLRYLEIFEDCDPEWRVYSEQTTADGVQADGWEEAEPIPPTGS